MAPPEPSAFAAAVAATTAQQDGFLHLHDHQHQTSPSSGTRGSDGSESDAVQNSGGRHVVRMQSLANTTVHGLRDDFPSDHS